MYDPSAKDKKQIWLQIAKFKPKTPLTGDIDICLLFVMPIPKSWYRTGKYSHLLKDQFKGVVYHSFKPDLDNLAKLICDVLQPQFYVDDSQISMLFAEKIYGKEPRTEVTIEEIS